MQLPGYVPSTRARGQQLVDGIAARVESTLAPYRRLAAEAHMVVRHDPLAVADDVWDGIDMDESVETQALAWLFLDMMHATDALDVSWAGAMRMASAMYAEQRQGILRQMVWRHAPEPQNEERPYAVRTED